MSSGCNVKYWSTMKEMTTRSEVSRIGGNRKLTMSGSYRKLHNRQFETRALEKETAQRSDNKKK